MTRKRIDLIAGARPNFMKIAPIIDALEAFGGFEWRLVHTGQHYDSAMSGTFFQQLGIPEPHHNLEVGSGTQAGQAGAIMARYEALLSENPCDLCIVVGDVTSTMACSLVARKEGIPVAHVEGGIRSGDWTMPEEINRVVTDALANWFFTTSEHAGENLMRAGVGADRIFFVGNTMIDTLLKQQPRFRRPAFWDELALEEGNYLVVTLHRPANVDAEEKLLQTLRAIARGAAGKSVVFPVHPRTAGRLKGLSASLPNMHYVDPQGYLEFNYLVSRSLGVVTDSGGITEETTVMAIPCLTLRDNTERPETVDIGTNELVGTDPTAIAPALARLLGGNWKRGGIPELWDGHAAERIVSRLVALGEAGLF